VHVCVFLEVVLHIQWRGTLFGYWLLKWS